MRGPVKLVLGLGLVVGLAFVLCNPPWTGGADEGTHFARALEMAHSRLTPGEIDGQISSPIPASYRDDQNRAIENFDGPSPFDGDMLQDLLDSTPHWDDTFVVDTQPTTAATPVAYAPAALAMALPDRLGWAGVEVLWAGRAGDLLVYLLVCALAVRVATAFRWTLAVAALFPANLAIAASLSPDALTIAAFLLVLAVWTRVWRPPGRTDEPERARAGVDRPEGDRANGDRPTGDRPNGDRTGEDRSPDAVLAAVLAGVGGSGPDDTAPATVPARPAERGTTSAAREAAPSPHPGGPGRRARLSAWSTTPLGTGAMVLAASVLLVLTKPPYFLIVALFPALLLVRRTAPVVAGAVAGVVALALGGLFTLVTSSGSYKAVTVTLGGTIAYQPDVQQERLLSDPLAFVGRCLSDWFTNLPETVSRWSTRLGYWPVQLPTWVPWVVLAVLALAAAVLDRADLLHLRRLARFVVLTAYPLLTLVLYASSYIYFDDSVEGTRMGLQIPRYTAPFFALGLMGWFPRLPLRLPADRPWSTRIPRWVPVLAVVTVELVVAVAAVRTWLWTGEAPTF